LVSEKILCKKPIEKLGIKKETMNNAKPIALLLVLVALVSSQPAQFIPVVVNFLNRIAMMMR
jgi:hypothetical protein